MPVKAKQDTDKIRKDQKKPCEAPEKIRKRRSREIKNN